ncbi:MAG: polyphosphate kinase 2 family protein [Acidobacteriota bacterium]|nr:polyphosphate kinase 2 family protein [Acidobacteriota bacterium]
MKLKSPFQVSPQAHVRLKKLRTTVADGPASEETAAPLLARHCARLDALQEIFYAGQQYAMLIVLQGMDTAGKDGAIRHIFSGVNPQGCQVTPFKTPTPIELRHDFLWRAHAAVPAKGIIGIFNRSHYEDLLYPRVHGQISGKVVRSRIDDINHFEDTLWNTGTVILKFFLHISHEEQTRRLQSRLDHPDKHWKLSPADFAERKFWPEYLKAYEDLLPATSRRHAPWFVIPADHKWQAHLAISQILLDTMGQLKLKYPKPEFDPATIIL